MRIMANANEMQSAAAAVAVKKGNNNGRLELYKWERIIIYLYLSSQHPFLVMFISHFSQLRKSSQERVTFITFLHARNI